MSTSVSVTIKQPTIDGQRYRCPGAGPGEAARTLTLMASGPATVMATCGATHHTNGRKRRARCFHQATIPGLTPQLLTQLAARPGRLALRLGDAELGGTVQRTAPTRRVTATAPKAGHKSGKPEPEQKPAIRHGTAAGRSGGFFGALTALFTAVGQIAGAVSTTAKAAGTAVSSTAGAVGKTADVGREGLRTVQTGINAAENTAARRFARDNTQATDDDTTEGT